MKKDICKWPPLTITAWPVKSNNEAHIPDAQNLELFLYKCTFPLIMIHTSAVIHIYLMDVYDSHYDKFR